MEKLIGKDVKVSYNDGDGTIRAIRGILDHVTDKELTVKFYDGRIVVINRNRFVRITEQ